MSILSGGAFLLPPRGADLTRWAVVACDQYTSSPSYWEKLAGFVGDAPSTLDLICPEAFLSGADARLPGIAAASEKYAESWLVPYEGMALVRRSLPHGDRYGLVCLADLEAYSYEDGGALIRATEGTVLERIPPRMKVRAASRLDVPHVICLIDDPEGTVIEPLVGAGDPLYDFSLYTGGRLEGRLIKDTRAAERALGRLQKRAEEEGRPFVLVGDGNHSLAAAKAHYERLRAAGDRRAERARYALVEVENLRSGAVAFEPIHRILYNAGGFAEYVRGRAGGFTLISGGRETVMPGGGAVKAYEEAQAAIDEYIASYGGSVDYIHGEGELRALCAERGGVGLLMPALPKSELFAEVSERGRLPRKTFSMGEADEKRFYMESRDIGKP